ncbi:hypothetical protein SLEP1_g9191 [Rubroshorea leprosula]|uniref:DUF4220 domain-containing protein n=1 Tax=Rubroshorea leprosula TaxID=152421 RepID=A0AAV5IDC1_9ROSI|nr:hypothetical protein SLEP1_g9191 [Rubroshorea leprosula]
MLLSIPDSVRRLWERWNLRGLIIVSLSLQAFLIMFASSRKRRGGWKIVTFIWSAYLLADWVATVAIGLISSGLGLTPSSQANMSTHESNDILAFWAPFLLLHLGGPDTITSFALEDNELWVRHMLGLALQVLSTIYVLLQSLPKNILWLPSGFMFIAGIIKYAERTRALYLASSNHFEESACRKPNPSAVEYQRIQRRYSSIKRAYLPARIARIAMIKRSEENFENMEYLEDFRFSRGYFESTRILQFAFEFFDTLKGLVAGLPLSPEERRESRAFFLRLHPNYVIQIIEIELSILYEVLHTKVQVIRCKGGYIFRSVSFGCILGAFFSFLFVKKHSFQMFDIRLTYGLLIGAMVLDFISLIFVIFSDWTFRHEYGDKGAKNLAFRVINRRRWSESVSQYNFFTYCLKDYPEWVNKLAEALRLRSILEAINGMQHRSSKKFRKNEEWHFICSELMKKSWTAETVAQGKRISLQRGDGILSKCENENLRQSIHDFEYTESLLMWHIATEFCDEDKAEVELCDENEAEDGPSSENIDYKSICKLLSDYMFYLLMMQPTMMAPVYGNWKLVFQDTFAETKRFLSEDPVSTPEAACEAIRKVGAQMKPRALKGGESISILFDAVILADELKKLNVKRWELMSKVWVEFMSYAAINCRAYVHAQQPSNGGELLTFVWLLMNHLGLGTQVTEREAVEWKFVAGK